MLNNKYGMNMDLNSTINKYFIISFAYFSLLILRQIVASSFSSICLLLCQIKQKLTYEMLASLRIFALLLLYARFRERHP